MDISTKLRDAAIRIRDSIDRYAGRKGWLRQDYHIDIAANVSWLFFQVTIAAKAFDVGTLKNDLYSLTLNEVYDHLENDLKDDPELFEATGIIITPYSFAFRKRFEHENYIEIDDSLLNPGWQQPEVLEPNHLAG